MQSRRTGNLFLDLVGEADPDAWSAMLAGLDRLDFDEGERLQRAGNSIAFSFFPTRGVLSLACDASEGIEVNTLGLGSDSAIHVFPDLQLEKAAAHVVSHLAGSTLRFPASRWQEIVRQSEPVRLLSTKYSDFLLARVQQSLACHVKHDVESRFCGWLLDLHRWQDGGLLSITHQGLARLIGVRRTTVSLIMERLQDAGIVSYRRATIEVTDIYALRQASCACHRLDHPWRRLIEDQTSIILQVAAAG